MFALSSSEQLGQNLSNLFASKSINDQNVDQKVKNKLKNDDNDMDLSEEENINLANIKVTVGIDEDLQMILEMDPSIVDLGIDAVDCGPAASLSASPLATPKINRWSPISAG